MIYTPETQTIRRTKTPEVVPKLREISHGNEKRSLETSAYTQRQKQAEEIDKAQIRAELALLSQVKPVESLFDEKKAESKKHSPIKKEHLKAASQVTELSLHLGELAGLPLPPHITAIFGIANITAEFISKKLEKKKSAPKPIMQAS